MSRPGRKWRTTGRGPRARTTRRTERSESTHVYTTKYELKIWVYDAAGTLLGELTKEHWD